MLNDVGEREGVAVAGERVGEADAPVLVAVADAERVRVALGDAAALRDTVAEGVGALGVAVIDMVGATERLAVADAGVAVDVAVGVIVVTGGGETIGYIG